MGDWVGFPRLIAHTFALNSVTSKLVESIMANGTVTMALAKVLVAAAWADGNITVEELNCLKDLLFQLPGMTARDWDQLDIYIDMPVSAAERDRLVEELRSFLKSKTDRDRALAAIDVLANADGALSPEEAQTVAEIREVILSSGAGLSSRFGKFMGNSIQRREKSLQNTPNREIYLQDFVRNKIYYSVSRRLELSDSRMDVPETELRRLSLAGGLMARVAYVDRQVQAEEVSFIVRAIQEHWQTSDVHAALVAEVAVSEIGKGMDYYRLTREFFECTTETERARFLDALFSVAASDGRVSNAELEEIRTIATVLKLTHQQFIDAKLKVPEEQR
jgi:uncharacterized tellurite resistance protein B-like protein